MKTKKLLIGGVCLGALTMISPMAYSQSETPSGGDNSPGFGKGTNLLSIGLGLGGSYTYFGDGYTSTPNFVLTYDNGTFGNVGPGTISLGALVAYKGISYDYTDFHSGYYYDQKWNYVILGFRSAYHFAIPTMHRFDPYVGVMLAYYDISYRETSSDPEFNVPGNPYYTYYVNNYSSYMAFSLYIGARYFVTNKIGLWLELGYGYSDAAIGVSFKF